MVALTLATGAAVVTGLFALLFIVQGFRGAYWDYTLIGGLLLVLTWWLL